MSSLHDQPIQLSAISSAISEPSAEPVNDSSQKSSVQSRGSANVAPTSSYAVPENANTSQSGGTKLYRIRAALQYGTCCTIAITNGWSDGSTGALLPRIQEFYHVNFTTVSLLFVAACIGAILGAFINVHLADRLGFGRTLLLGGLIQAIGCAFQASALPFPVFVLSFAINGVGKSLQGALAIGYTAALKDSLKMGVLEAGYGAGALIAPTVATHEGLVLFGAIMIFFVFGNMSQDECLARAGQTPREPTASETTSSSKMKQILKHRAVQMLSLCMLVYVGAEVTIGGWIVSYMQELRGGGDSAGYISTGFFAGLTVGRIALLWVNNKVGENRVVYIYSVLCIGFVYSVAQPKTFSELCRLELIVWFVPSFFGSAISTALVGLFLGPFFPILVNHSGRVLPPWILTASIGYISAVGQSGGAILPFLTGAMASKFGIQSLQPLVVSMLATFTVLWWCVPSGPGRVD
ncbi:MFS general substrate transporter [Flagelloscypha sp. PMI_526]|nr:MFS general substrate transporter [Flagelloscypha sp. PMI_526]